MAEPEASTGPKRYDLSLKRVVDGLEVPEAGDRFYWDARLEGFACRVYASGRKVFIIRYRTGGGRQRWYKIGVLGKLTPSDAWDDAFSRLGKVLTDDPARERDRLRTQPTLGETLDRYIREKLPKLAASERATRKAQLTWWKGELGSLPLSDVTRADIAAARDRLAATPVTWGKEDKIITSKPRSPATVNRYLAALSNVLAVAADEWQLIEVNPARRLARARETKGRERYLSTDEVKALVKAAEADREKLLGPVVLVALATGARRGELLGLRWPDVDTARGFVTFRDTKNRDTRSVPVTGRALEALKALSRVRRLKDDRVFRLTLGELRGAWERATKAAGLEGFVFHALRHSAASWLVMSGVSLREVAEILGHKTLSMVQRYSHLAPDHLRESVQKMTEKLGI